MLKTLIFLSSVRSLLMTLQFLNGLKHSYSEQQQKEHMNNSRSSGYTFISVITRQIGNGMAKTGGGGYQMKVSSPLLSYLQNYLFTKKFKMFFQTFADSYSKNQQYTVVENYPKKVWFCNIYAVLGSRCFDNQLLFAKFCSYLFW